MDELEIKYQVLGGGPLPRPIRMSADGWAGLPQHMRDGSQPQPWHCLPFVEGSAYGLELVYPYETQCQVINEEGSVRIEFDFAREPGGGLTGSEFVLFAPTDAAKYYLFAVRLDLQPPADYVIRTEPHPRYFTDETGTVPLAMIGHVQSHWWPKRFFVVFRAPFAGQRHVFRKGEPYAQLLFVPHHVRYRLTPMTPDEAARRRELEFNIAVAKSRIADNVWHNPEGEAFDNHYKLLASAFAQGGAEAVESLAMQAKKQHEQSLPADKPVGECLAVALEHLRDKRYTEARDLYLHVLRREPRNAEAAFRLGMVAALTGVPSLAVQMMSQAVSVEPTSTTYQNHLGELLRRLGRPADAESCFRASLRIDARQPAILGTLGLTVAQQGRASEALDLCRAATEAAPVMPLVHCRVGQVLAIQRRFKEARAAFERCLALDPQNAEAKAALGELPAAGAAHQEGA